MDSPDLNVPSTGPHSRSSTRHVCFVAPQAWPVLVRDRSIETVGGAEVQQCALARAFAAHGHRVSMICLNYGQLDRTLIDGIEVHRAHAPKEGIPIVRFIHPRLTSIWTAMSRIDADVYYQRGCGAMTGFVAAFCRRNKRAFIFAAASNADFDPKLPLLQYGRDKALYRWGLRHANAVVVQNSIQQSALHERFGRVSRLIPSCYAPPEGATCDPGGYVLWVSTMRKLKRPQMFLELAEMLPDVSFRMVGGPDDPALFRELEARARRLRNVEFVGFVPHAEIEEQFNGARVFVNTSEFEGFPNTFLQSWARSIPTVSFFDTGCAVGGMPVVQRVDNLPQMANAVARLMTDDDHWRACGARGQRLYLDRHSTRHVVAAYGSILDEIIGPASQVNPPSHETRQEKPSCAG